MVVTELMPNGSLSDVLDKWLSGNPPPGFGPTELSKCIFGVAVTMAQVHTKGAIHRDLKPGNVFLDEAFEPRIADFGLARLVEDSINMTMAVGCPLYMAPELYAGSEGYGLPVDVYAYGVLLYQVFTKELQLDEPPPGKPSGKSSGQASTVMVPRIVKGARLRRHPNIPDMFWELITQCWSQNPRDRPSFSEIVDQMRGGAFVIRGTDMERYREYQERIMKPADRDPAPPWRADPLGRAGTTVEDLAAGSPHFAELLEASRAAMAARPRRQRRYDFSRIPARRP
jgi:serine/threonine protein kinase